MLSLCLIPASRHSIHALPLLPPREPVSPRRELLHTCGVQVFIYGAPVSVAATQGLPFDYLALEARGACNPGSHRTVTIRETVLSTLPPPGHSTESRLKHSFSLSVKEAYPLVQELQPEGQPPGLAHTDGPTPGALKEWRPAETIFVFSRCLAPAHRYLPERNLFPCLAP